MRFILSLLVIILGSNMSGAFLMPSLTRMEKTITTRNNFSPDGAEHAIDSASFALSLLRQATDQDAAKTDFYFFFFAGSGASAIGILQIPRVLQQLKDIRELEDTGPTEGGDVLKVSPLVGLIYPSISKKDVEKVIKMPIDPEKINAQSLSNSYAVKQGYIRRSDFVDSLKGCNPLAAYAIFEAMSGGSGNVIPPPKLEESIATYRGEAGLDAFTKDLESALTTKLFAYAVLLFLVFVAVDLIVESGINAFA